MIPNQLTLHNFLSYRHTQVNFRGLHVACVCGPNGAGKSSLLEAIAWAVWGQSRASTEDGVIYLGSLEAQVDFVFEHQHQTYRIVRSRHRQQGGNLEFQVQTEGQFRSLTQRGMRATQQLICETLRLDYDTFVNSAYLRQGKADEFMVKRPSERKQILADLLKLCQYDTLADQAKGRSRQAQAQADVVEQTLAGITDQLAQRSALLQEAADLEAQLTQLQQAVEADQAQLAHWHQVSQQRQAQQQALALLHQRQEHLAQQRSRLATDREAHRQRQAAVEQVLGEAVAIAAGWQQLQDLQAQEEALGEKFAQVQALQQQQQILAQAHQTQVDHHQQQRQEAVIQLTWIDQQLTTLEATLAKADTVAAAWEQFQAAQAHLRHLDKQQAAAAPLRQEQQHLETQLAQAQAHLTAQLQALDQSSHHLQQQLASQPQVQQAAVAVGQTLEQLAARRAYQEQVREKGLERRSFMEQLQATQRSHEVQLAQLDQKLQLISAPDVPCPLCDRPLDALHWQLVRRRHQEEREEIQQDIWAIREQLAVSEREIQVLRQEYRDLEAELADYGTALEQRGQLQAQLASGETLRQRLDTLTAERYHLEQCLHEGDYALEVRQALAQVTAQLTALAYDERDHALARGQVDRLRWADIKQAEIAQAQRQWEQLHHQRPEWEQRIATADQYLAALETSETAQTLQALRAQLAALDYSPEAHQRLRGELRQAQPWAERYAALKQARDTWPQVQATTATLAQQWDQLMATQATLEQERQGVEAVLAALPDPQGGIPRLTQANSDRQQQREALLSRTGALQQQLTHLGHLQTQATEYQQTLLTAQHQSRVYQELAIAFGRNGLQALLIENILPQLETDANHILSRLSAHQLHVQFVTQRAGRSKSKLIDTLDILIADAQGTRPYETYSGGEAFRVNFAIRLALARLLAQRSGTPLQLLIIDEGFGTQDQEGCDRLIGAINAIASDFQCILVVTHVPHFREAFQTRIDITKTPAGSQVCLSL